MSIKNKFGRKDITYITMIILSAFLYAVGMNVFVHSGNLFPGGYAGISRLLSLSVEKYLNISISFSIIYFALNIVTTLFVWKRIGHKFICYSILWYTLTSIFTNYVPYFEVTSDPLLIAVFGGLLNGLAVGISLKNNASSGGTDFIAIDLSIRLNRPTWNYMFVINAIVLIIAGFEFGWNQALYSIIFQYVSKEIVNMMHQRYKITRLNVITDFPEEISKAVFDTCRHGITKLECEGEYSHQKHYLLLMNINTYQLNDVIDAIKAVDHKAFISISDIDRVVGNYYQKPLE